ncbi:substrate-binding domain-containing protein [Acuticoccus sp.]|uniref:substrate-binding domain-containing protein n=1 Tax=Acuticoccus sp. TaxID=1904378 RepID=UPI003B526447
MKFNTIASVAALAAAGALVANGAVAQSRDQIRIVGSSTVFPYTQAVSEEYANATGNAAPVVESTGTGGGMQIFCEGVGPNTPDITGASREMKASEYELCQENGVTDVTEVLIGYDGLSIAVAQDSQYDWQLTEQDLYTALAAEVPVDGEIVANPHTVWSDIRSELPEVEITVFGPPPTSGTRDAFVELAMQDGCNEYDVLAEMQEADEERWEVICSTMRTDGPFIEAGENDNLIVQRLQSDTDALGIFGYSFLYENQDTLKAVEVNGVEPTFETIAAGDYDIARPLYFYIKNAHRDAIPGLTEFIEMYVAEEALGPDGYLKDRGLTTLSDERRQQTQQNALEGESMGAPS